MAADAADGSAASAVAPPVRKIIHVDMDAFYAAVEQRDFPQYQGKPVVVGGSPDKRGVVATASYEARVFGIHSAMPAARAYRLCPQAVFLRPRFSVYKEVSEHIREAMHHYTELVEPLSLDEAYLDVTQSALFENSASRIARDLRQRIYDSTRLTASAGVSYNKFLAKLASDIDKPNGQFLITPEDGPAFVEQLPIGKFHGIGKATEAKMQRLGIFSGADLKTWPLERLLETFGKTGHFYYSIARGIDQRPVSSHRERKSISTETTFEFDLSDTAEMLRRLQELARKVEQFIQNRDLRPLTLTIKVKYNNFQQVTRSVTASRPFLTVQDIQAQLPELLAKTEAADRPVRLLGVGVSNFNSAQSAAAALASGSDQPNASRPMQQLELF